MAFGMVFLGLAGVISLYRLILQLGVPVLPAAALRCLAQSHRGLSAQTGPLHRRVLRPGPGRRAGLHHRHRLHRRGGRRHLAGRTGGGILDVGVRPAGDVHQSGGKNALCPPARPSPRRRLAGRPYVLSQKPGPGGLVRSGLHPGHFVRRESGPVRVYLRRPARAFRPRQCWCR